MAMQLCVLLVILVWICGIAGRPTSHVQDPASIPDQETSVPDPRDANRIMRLHPVEQLLKYGYMTKNPASDHPASGQISSITEPLKRFQHFNGLNETGELDNATLTLMATPRCGSPDLFNTSMQHRQKRYVSISRWTIKSLTYHVGQTRKMSQSDVQRVIRKAFKIWSDVSGLTFTNAFQNPTIDISFRRLDHGDDESFDGPGGVLAHAYFPHGGGNIHLDEDEPWTQRTRLGVNLLQIVTHELGHSLGLAHTPVSNAIMYAYYRGYNQNFKLATDDITGIQSLYGKNLAAKPPRPTPQPFPTTRPTAWPPAPPPWPQPTQRPNPNWPPRPTQTPWPTPPWNPNPNPIPTKRPTPRPTACVGSGQFDAIFSIKSNTYAIEGSQVYKLNSEAVDSGYPIHIQTVFSVPIQRVDAALVLIENSREYVYLFEVYMVWKFNEDLNSVWFAPQSVQAVFPGLPVPIDAAFYSSFYNSIYFFKDSQYYRSSAHFPNQYKIDVGYPKMISNWNFGYNIRITAIFVWVDNKRMYIFTRNQYYRYNQRRRIVDPSIVPYPREVRKWWLGCKSQNIMAAITGENSTTNGTESEANTFHEVADNTLESEETPQTFHFVADRKNNETDSQGHLSKTNGLSNGIIHKRRDTNVAGSAVKLQSTKILMIFIISILICSIRLF